MSKYIDADNLITEIRRIVEEETPISKGSDYYHGVADTADKLLSFITSLQQEQQESTCKTCGFYENNCPFIRGKLIPYPNRICKDYTYSAMKEQEQPDNEDIDKVAQELYGHIYELKRRNNVPTNLYDRQEIINLWKAGVEYGHNYPKQVQPEVDLEKEIDNVIADYSFTKTIDSGGFKTTVLDYAKIAHHFYELGLNARK